MKLLDEVRDRYVVVDFLNTLWKSWAVRPTDSEDLLRADGYPTGHVFRMFRTLYKWKRDFAGHLVIAYEGNNEERYSLFPEYKAGRKKDHEFNPVPDVKRMLRYVKCTELKPVGGEADDAIATFVKKRPEANHLILSSDKDLWACLDKNVQIVSFRDMLGRAHIEKTYKKHFGTQDVKSITLAKALFGDKSDNLPSVPRLFKKHVAELLGEVSTPDQLFSSLDDVPPKTAQKLRDHEEQVRMVFEVARLRDSLRLRRRDREGNPALLREFLNDFECSSLIPHVDFMAS